MMKRCIPGFLLAWSSIALAGDAMPWENAVAVSVTVNGHSFHDAKVKSQGCVLSYELFFNAPENGYADPKNMVRNRHSFQARIQFAKGQTATSNRFGNGAPGERVYRFEDDTSASDCWGKAPNKIVKVDVIGCRGRNCDLGSFE